MLVKMDDNHLAAHKMAERQDMLILAQQKLDENNRANLGLSSGRPGSASSRNRQRKSAVATHLLSSLLYMALSAHKLEDIKAMLAEEDGDSYDEWRPLLETLHSPEFHIRERMMQNQRVKRTFERKKQYKQENVANKKKLEETLTKLNELQMLSNETSHQLSASINTLQENESKLISKNEELRCQIEASKDSINQLQKEFDFNNERVKSLQTDVSRKDEQLEEKCQSITELEKSVWQYKNKASVAQTEVSEIKTKLESAELEYSKYREDKESILYKLQQDLAEARSSNSVLNTKLESSNKALNVVNQALQDSKQNLAATKASFDEITSRSDNLKDLVQTGLSRLDDKFVATGSVLQESSGHLEHILAHNNQVSDSLAILSSLSNQTETIEGSLSKVQEVLTTQPTAEALQQCLSSIDQSLNAASELQKSNLRQEVSNVLQTLDGISQHQQDGMQRELLNVHTKLDSISQHQQDNGIQRELSNVKQQLDELSQTQQLNRSNSQLELLSVQKRLENLPDLNKSNDSFHQELLKVHKKLDTVSSDRTCNSLHQELSDIQQQLNELMEHQHNHQGNIGTSKANNASSALLQKISSSIEFVCDQCASIESNIYDSDLPVDELIELIAASIGNMSDRCSNIKSDVQDVLDKSKMIPTPPISASTDETPSPATKTVVIDDSGSLERNLTSMSAKSVVSASAGELVDNFMSEAVARM